MHYQHEIRKHVQEPRRLKGGTELIPNCEILFDPSWWVCRPRCDGDEVLLEDVDVPAQLGEDGRDGGGGQVARQDEEGAALVQLAVNLLPLRQLALLAQAL